MHFLPPQWHPSLPSTSTFVLSALKRGTELPDGFVLAAREQTAGRGRRRRRWVSQPGRDLSFSFVLRTRKEAPHLASLSMAVALGVAGALDEFGLRAQTKWPNDVLVEGRKISGILAEPWAPAHSSEQAMVLGVGLNVNMSADEAAAIDRPATSLRLETGEEHPVEAVLEAVLRALPARIEAWKSGGFEALRPEWRARCCLVGEHIVVGEGKERRAGVLEGFGAAGQLLLRDQEGILRQIWAGDVV